MIKVSIVVTVTKDLMEKYNAVEIIKAEMLMDVSGSWRGQGRHGAGRRQGGCKAHRGYGEGV